MQRLRSKLTYANVIATIALFVALGGTVYAAGAINGRQIKAHSLPANRLEKHSITRNQLKMAKLGTLPSAKNATNAANATDSAALGGIPSSGFVQSANLLSAVVSNDGTAQLVRGTAGTTVTRVSAGDVFVRFPRNISQCAWVASVGQPGANFLAPGAAGTRGANDGDPNTVQVITWNSFATLGTQADLPFHLIVSC